MRKLLILLILLMLVSNAAGYFVGSLPGVRDMGEVERGETYELNYYLTSNADNVIEVDPEIRRPSKSTYRGVNTDYDYDEEEASMESIEPWISFKQETFRVDPSTSEGYDLPDGGTVSANGRLTLFLEIPRDAEPGYHVANVHLKVLEEGEDGSGQGITTYGVSHPTLVFRVPGEVEHDLEITGVEGLRAGDTEAYVDVKVTNRGSVTTLVDKKDLSIFNSNGVEKRSFDRAEYKFIAPDETKNFRLEWSQGNDIPAGNYRIRGNVNYFTGKAFLDETFDITSFIQIEQTNETDGGIIPSGEGEEGEGLPVWLVVMFLILVGALMYSFEIDPLLIILAMGALGISIFIWMSGLPLFLLAVVILISAALLYYGWM